MAVRIRLFRMGRKKRPFYRIVVMDSRVRRDGRYLDKVGYYNPITKPATVQIDKEKVLDWLKKGAEPSKTVFNLLQKEGIALEWHLIRNKVSEETRNIELQKWELAKKDRESKLEVEKKPEVQPVEQEVEVPVKEEVSKEVEKEEVSVKEEPKEEAPPAEEKAVKAEKEEIKESAKPVKALKEEAPKGKTPPAKEKAPAAKRKKVKESVDKKASQKEKSKKVSPISKDKDKTEKKKIEENKTEDSEKKES